MKKIFYSSPFIYIALKNKFNLKIILRDFKAYKIIKKDNLLDKTDYIKKNQKLEFIGIDPILHYMYHGFKEGKTPGSAFDQDYYLNKYSDVKKSGINPLVHYTLYGKREGRFKSDLNELRTILKSLKQSNSKKKILYVLHEEASYNSGGTGQTTQDILDIIQETFECYILSSAGKNRILWSKNQEGMQKLKTWEIKQKWSLNQLYSDDFKKMYLTILKELRPDLIHVQHLYNHTFDLPFIAEKLKIPTILSFHDFYYICPSVNLLNENNIYCEGKCHPNQEQCQINVLPSNTPLLKELIPIWRNEISKIFDIITVLTAPTASTMDLYEKIYPQLKNKTKMIIEHGRDFRKSEIKISSFSEKIKILVPGNIFNHKGSQFIKDLKENDIKNIIEFHFMGQIDPELKEIGIYHGKYHREDFCRILTQIKPSFIGIFSICPETYCHTLSESWSCGVPVLATNLGALKERVNQNRGGWLLDCNSPSNAYHQIIEISNSHENYLETVLNVSKINLRTKKEMCDDYKRLYLQIISNY